MAKAGGIHKHIWCLVQSGIGITDPDPTWHPEGLTHFDPTPAPFLTHENVMEKLSHTLGSLLRAATGMCTDICQVPISPRQKRWSKTMSTSGITCSALKVMTILFKAAT